MMRVLAILVLCALPSAGIAADEPAEILLPTGEAKLEGNARYDDGANFKCVRNWSSTNVVLRWTINVPARAAYRIFVTYASPKESLGGEAEVAVGSQVAKFALKPTGDWRKFQEQDIGPVLLRTPGPAELTVRVTKKSGPAWDFRSLRLVPER